MTHREQAKALRLLNRWVEWYERNKLNIKPSILPAFVAQETVEFLKVDAPVESKPKGNGHDLY